MNQIGYEVCGHDGRVMVNVKCITRSILGGYEEPGRKYVRDKRIATLLLSYS